MTLEIFFAAFAENHVLIYFIDLSLPFYTHLTVHLVEKK